MAVETTPVPTPTAPGDGAAHAELPSGPTAAAMIAAGLGTLALGIFTTLAEASSAMHDFLEFNARVGPLSGKTILAVCVFLGSWAILAAVWRQANPPFDQWRHRDLRDASSVGSSCDGRDGTAVARRGQRRVVARPRPLNCKARPDCSREGRQPV